MREPAGEQGQQGPRWTRPCITVCGKRRLLLRFCGPPKRRYPCTPPENQPSPKRTMRSPFRTELGIEVAHPQGSRTDTNQHAHRKYRVYPENTRGHKPKNDGPKRAFPVRIPSLTGREMLPLVASWAGEAPWYAYCEEQRSTHNAKLHAPARFACVRRMDGAYQPTTDMHACLREARHKSQG